MQSLRIPQPNQVELIELPVPQPGAGEVLLRVAASGICGTDVHILRGEYMGGYPVIPGHEFSGEVVAVGTGVTRVQVGDRAAVEPNIPCERCVECLNNRENFCLNWKAVGVTLPGGMSQYVLAPEAQVFNIGDLAYDQAAFVEPLSCVLHGLEQLAPRMGDKILLAGSGPIGMLLLRGLRALGAARVDVAERQAARLAFAGKEGAGATLADLSEAKVNGYDAVVDATGSPAVMARLLDYARPGGKVLWFGVPPNGAQMTIEPFKVFQKGLTIQGSFTSRRNSYQAVDLLRSGRIRVDDLVSHHLRLDQFEHGVQLIERGLEDVRKVMILPNG
jgi:D-arabinitol dehydrogenase (NADP+)